MDTSESKIENPKSKIQNVFARYARQMRFEPLGMRGQQLLSGARVTLVGCGALGSASADLLVRSGVGHLRIVDRDFVELTNLQRQSLFDEQDVQRSMPKAVAAAEKLKRVNSEIEIEPLVADVDWRNIERLCSDADLILDGTDNFETRFLVNEFAIKHDIPWVFGGCLADHGQVMAILPGQTPCLRCLMPDGPPPAGTGDTCDAVGILNSAVAMVAALQAMESIKILAGRPDSIARRLIVLQLWNMDVRLIDVGGMRDGGSCLNCVQRQFPLLEGQQLAATAVLCGRNAVQLRFGSGDNSWQLNHLAQRLSGLGRVIENEYLVKLVLDDHEITAFSDGRVIVSGTDNPTLARQLCAQYLGT